MNQKTITDAFEHYIVAREPQTQKSYRSAFNRLISNVYSGEDVLLSDVSVDDLVEYRQALSGMKRRSINTYMSPIKGLFRHIALRGWSDFGLADYELALDEIATISGGRTEQPLPKLPKENNVQAILNAARQEWLDPGRTDRQRVIALRDRAIVHTLRATGMRVGELVGLRVGDVDMDNKTCIVNGKGNKQRLAMFDDKAWETLVDYMAEVQLAGDDPVFIRMDSLATIDIMPMSTDAIRDVLNRLADLAGVPHITPHQFRHRFGLAVHEGSGDDFALQDLMGHSNLQTTRIYTKLSVSSLKKAHGQAAL